MQDAIAEEEIPIHYDIKIREVGLRVLDGTASTVTIHHCPWCGAQLPDSLREAWFAELEKWNIDPFQDEIPSEFLDDRWYRSKGL